MHDEDRRLYATSTEIIKLGRLESKVLSFLIKNKRRVVSSRDIAYYLYGKNYQHKEKNICQIIHSLNKSIRDISIVNVYDYGYVIFNCLGRKNK